MNIKLQDTGYKCNGRKVRVCKHASGDQTFIIADKHHRWCLLERYPDHFFGKSGAAVIWDTDYRRGQWKPREVANLTDVREYIFKEQVRLSAVSVYNR